MDQSAARLANRPEGRSRQETLPEARNPLREVRPGAEPVRSPVRPRDRVVIALLWTVALVVMGSWALALVAALRWLL